MLAILDGVAMKTKANHWIKAFPFAQVGDASDQIGGHDPNQRRRHDTALKQRLGVLAVNLLAKLLVLGLGRDGVNLGGGTTLRTGSVSARRPKPGANASGSGITPNANGHVLAALDSRLAELERLRVEIGGLKILSVEVRVELLGREHIQHLASQGRQLETGNSPGADVASQVCRG